MIDRQSLIVFVGSLVALAGGFVAVSWLTGVSLILLAPAYMFTPFFAGLATYIAAGKSFERAGLRFPWNRLQWLALAALIPIVLVLLGTGLALGLPGVEFVPDANPLTGEGTDFAQVPEGADGETPDGPSFDWPLNLLVALVAALVVGATINAIFALGEEFGWRGVLLTELAPLGFWGASAAIGVVWGLWHAPIILEGYNYPSYPLEGVAVMTLACLAMSPVYTYVAVRAKSVVAPTVLHGVFNGFATTMLVFAQGGHELLVNPVGGIGIAVFGLAALAIALTGTPTLTDEWALEEADEDSEAESETEAGDRTDDSDLETTDSADSDPTADSE
ncbi:CPBP family intramembrane glutamic endopeptidase [Natronolimnobius sp. AArcel1]|uniref:CPBP family intramembrane glutamic endopeptidase n=1 Tax=Natronolimnobius sp. AArcel1 TaxID=1679093 RepID=UPI003743358A